MHRSVCHGQLAAPAQGLRGRSHAVHGPRASSDRRIRRVDHHPTRQAERPAANPPGPACRACRTAGAAALARPDWSGCAAALPAELQRHGGILHSGLVIPRSTAVSAGRRTWVASLGSAMRGLGARAGGLEPRRRSAAQPAETRGLREGFRVAPAAPAAPSRAADGGSGRVTPFERRPRQESRAPAAPRWRGPALPRVPPANARRAPARSCPPRPSHPAPSEDPGCPASRPVPPPRCAPPAPRTHAGTGARPPAGPCRPPAG